MLPKISPENTLTVKYKNYLNALQQINFSGEIKTNYSTRLSLSTDNSIYQLIPQAVVFPKGDDDIIKLFTLANNDDFNDIVFSPRGGGTATNGQSLSSGIIIDCSKYMTNILELNIEQQWVKVQPGVILDQLNDYLKAYGYCFATKISTSNRATIGGMINTNASGIGSYLYGTTFDHVISLKSILVNGSIFNSCLISKDDLQQELQNKTAIIYQQIAETIKQHKFDIAKLPKLSRPLSGYNLTDLYHDGHYNLNALFCGSEGTLGVVTEAKLKIIPIPKYKQIIVIKYRSFQHALLAAKELLAYQPSAMEAIDENVLNLARQDIIYYDNEALFDHSRAACSTAMNFVEFSSNDQNEISLKVNKLCQYLRQSAHKAIAADDFYIATTEQQINNLWKLRKKAVGLLANMPGKRRPIAFVEDTLVDPQVLPQFVDDFKKILQQHNLKYAMYGHVDSGCIHVRPALDLTQAEDKQLLRTISDNIVQLVKRYKGVIWGEHGKGFRSEYMQDFFGKTLYQEIRKIKAVFDPENKLNPGKLATPYTSEEKTLTLEGPLKAERDQHITTESVNQYNSIINCNGNGACFNYQLQETMCPSYKVTNDRIHSPKGRATLIREWLYQVSLLHYKPVVRTIIYKRPLYFLRKCFNTLFSQKTDYSAQVQQALHGCLGCKACDSECPVHVNIPQNKAYFLNSYYQRYLRSPRDHFIVRIEKWAPYFGLLEKYYNQLVMKKWLQIIANKWLGLIDIPKLNGQLKTTKPVKNWRAIRRYLKKLTAQEKAKTVLLLPDAFTRFYDAKIFSDSIQLIEKLGYQVIVLPYKESGKSWHVNGFMHKFNLIAHRNIKLLNQIAEFNIPIICLEPSIALMYRSEYQQIEDKKPIFKVHLLQEWLATNIHNWQFSITSQNNEPNYYLYSHCSEKSALADNIRYWKVIFKAFGLNIYAVNTGCCGMAGAYGHQLEHYQYSKKLYQMSWQDSISATDNDKILVSGYSCRSQINRFQQLKVCHPAQALLTRLVLTTE